MGRGKPLPITLAVGERPPAHFFRASVAAGPRHNSLAFKQHRQTVHTASQQQHESQEFCFSDRLTQTAFKL